MKLKTSDIVAALTLIAGVCGLLSGLILQTVATTQAQLHPGQPVLIPAGYIIASTTIGSVGMLASGLIRILTVKADAPTTAIAENAIIVPEGTTVVRADTPAVAANVTTTTTEPLAATAAGVTPT